MFALVAGALSPIPATAAPSASSGDVTISKTWIATPPVADGGSATARLKATNTTANPQPVTIRDTYDAGLTPGVLPTDCTAWPAPARVIECTTTVGGGVGVFAQYDIPFTVAYQGPKTYTKNWKTDERLTVQKQDKHWNLEGGEVKTFEISCPAGYFMIDQAIHKQRVDQDMGTLEDLRVQSTNLTPTKWEVVVENDSGGQGQGKLWAACMKQTTNQAGTIAIGAVQTQILSLAPVGDVPTEFHAICASGETPVAINLRAVQGGFWQDELFSQIGLYANGGPSAVLFAMVHETGTFTLQWRCMSTTSSSGRRMDLRLDSDSHVVPAGQQQDFTATCDDDEKGIVGGWRGAASNGQAFKTTMNGQEPRPKLRTYWMRNLTGSPLTYDTKLLCVGNRLVRGGKIDKTYTDMRCNYADGLIDGVPNDFWLNWSEVCLAVKQG